MELTQEHYRRAAVAYKAYCKQTGGKSLATGDTLPQFDALRPAIKDAWAAVAIALTLDAEMEERRLMWNAAKERRRESICSSTQEADQIREDSGMDGENQSHDSVEQTAKENR